MIFSQYGPFQVPINDRRRIEKSDLNEFWQEVDDETDGISRAVGCYIFALKNKSIMPWYIGMAEKQNFKNECFTIHKINRFNEALSLRKKGKPFLMFLPKTTPTDRYSKPSSNGHKDIQFLEKILIGRGATKNKELLNIKNTKLYKEIIVPGLFNSPSSHPYKETQIFKEMMGIN